MHRDIHHGRRDADERHTRHPGNPVHVSHRVGDGIDVSSVLRHPGGRVEDECFRGPRLACQGAVSGDDVVDSLAAAVAEGVEQDSLGGLVGGEDGGHGFEDVFSSLGFALEDEFFGGDGDEDDLRGGVERHVGAGVVGDVLGVGVGPGAEEDGGWIERRLGLQGWIWFVEVCYVVEACKCCERLGSGCVVWRTWSWRWGLERHRN